MTPLFKKPNLTTQNVLHVLNAPSSFALELAALEGDSIKRTVAVLWIAYPKGTSKEYKCEFNRDSGWLVLGAAGFEPVRQDAIDDDWSALRIPRVKHIKTMTRNTEGSISISGAGKAKAARRSDA